MNGVKNMVNVPTCYKGKTPTCIDLVVTNAHRKVQHITCFDIGLSDFHHMVCFSTKCQVPTRKKTCITYRSYKHFSNDNYLYDLSVAPFHVCEIFDDVNDAYWYSSTLLKGIINKHAPVKKRVVKHNQVPYMNSLLRKSMNVRDALRRKFERFKTSVNWHKYRKHRNYVTNLRRNSLFQYMKSKCNTTQHGDKPTEFWRFIKPIISDNFKVFTDIILMENNSIESDQNNVASILNDYFVNVAKDIGNPDTILDGDTFENIIHEYEDHQSIKMIRNDIAKCMHSLSFNNVSSEQVYNKLSHINIRKATGYDQVPPKMIKLGSEY